jgi:DASS family divalent anion:Na+ symporter
MKNNKTKLIAMIIGLIIGIAVAVAPIPDAELLTRASMTYMGIFITMMVWLVVGLVPEVICTFLAMTAFVVFKVESFNVVFAPLGQSTFWTIAGAFGMAAGVAKSGFLKRVAYKVMYVFPATFRGQVTALMAAGLTISPLIPSLAAKVAIVSPLATEISTQMGYEKGSKGAKGLFSAMYVSGALFGNGFYSGGAFTFFIFAFLTEQEIAKYDWFGWLKSTFVWLILLIVLSYLFINKAYKPDVESTFDREYIKQKSDELGPMTLHEKLSGLIVGAALVMWMLEKVTGVSAAAVAVGAMSAMVAVGILTKLEFRTRTAWESAFFIGTILSIAGMLSKTGVNVWLSKVLAPVLSPMLSSAWIFIPTLCIITYILRYFIMSQTALGAILFAIFGTLAPAAGISAWVVCFAFYMSTQAWNTSFNNTAMVAALGGQGSDLIEYKDMRGFCYAYMVINIIACTASIPLWMALGYIT